MVKVIRAEYDGLREVAKVFAHHADLSVALTFQVEGLVDQLQGGAWRGVGAESFYAEMVELVLPAMRKLEDALQFARDSTLKIIEIMQAAEAEAAALFRGLPGGEISYPQQDDDERRKHLIQMLLSTLRFSGMMNSPLPENLESLTVAELEALLDGNENAKRSREALVKLVLWVLDKVQSSRLEDDFWSLSAEQRYELLSALAWVMEEVGQGEMPNTALLDSFSEPVRGLSATTLLNVIQRLQQAQNDDLIDEEIRHNHLTAHYSGAVFADWLGNVTAFLSIGSVALFVRSAGSGGTGGRALAPDEQVHINRINSVDDWLNNHPDLAADARIVNAGGQLRSGYDHVTEANQQIGMLNKSVETLNRIRRLLNPEGQVLVDASITKAQSLIETIQSILKTR
ncbi:hypothetical protein ANRL4_05042 [Anaerolineae bacterium]|nr:hypothetical protein ANRL4_05042 [Anaerolineae bacterium]